MVCKCHMLSPLPLDHPREEKAGLHTLLLPLLELFLSQLQLLKGIVVLYLGFQQKRYWVHYFL